jgi:hypothetical protein
MRLEMQRRFLLLYKHYRHKKHGEPLPGHEQTPKDNYFNSDLEDVDDLFDDDKEFIMRIKQLQ